MQTAEARILDRDNPIDWLHSLVPADMAAVDRLVHERIGSAVPLIPDLARHLVDSGGKRLRPLLTIAAARLNGYRGTAHAKLAAAVEFIHTATLLHDDVVDVSALRRGKIAANVVWGNKSSVLVGDYLFSRAFQLMVEAGDVGVLDVLANASAVIAEGEVLQLRSVNNLATTREEYLRIIAAKTAALFAAAAEAGAMIGNAPREFTSAMRAFGHHLGIAFQLIDDALDYSGRQVQMGKSVGDDFREAKVTHPVIVAHERASEAAKEFWHRAIEDGVQHDGDLKRAIAIIDETGALDETRALAHHHARMAIAALAAVPPHEIRQALISVAEFCVSRGY
ncbi:MAG: polyprenyl synthetase family protein [Alphaproteobacteria bacterium]|nr:polyprenyl synthetase family protein [Alphaproteobacteria bacterium]MBV9062241.1 polyprenyl synthetase family protein [Alphaproteobacteria bacterium]